MLLPPVADYKVQAVRNDNGLLIDLVKTSKGTQELTLFGEINYGAFSSVEYCTE